MSETRDQREQEIADRARELFQTSVRDLDGQTRSRLAQARTRAVEAAAKRRTWRGFSPGLLAAGGVAAASLAVVVVLQWSDSAVDPIEAQVLSDLDILLEAEALEMFEDLEFYAWLLEQPEMLEQGEDDGTG